MTQPPARLRSLQQWVQSVITHPGGVASGVNEAPSCRAVHAPIDQLESVITRSKALTAEQRLAIYGDAYFGRLLECMQALFPIMCDLLGEEVFHQFAMEYLHKFPPTSYTLNDLANHFVHYLETTRPAGPADALWADFLIDLAMLEWKIDQVFDGPGTENIDPLSGDELAAIEPDAWPNCRLETAPCLHLFTAKFPINDFFTEIRNNPQAAPPPPGESFTALNRREYIVRRYTLSQPQFELLAALQRGETVGEAIAAAAEFADDLDTFAANLRQWFYYWTTERFFLACRE